MKKNKDYVGTIWLGPLEDRTQVLEALKQYQATLKRRNGLLPKQRDSRFQKIADNVWRKLESSELVDLPDRVNELVRGLSPDIARVFLSSLEAGGDVWDWEITWQGRGRSNLDCGWCVVLDGQIVATLCYSG